MKRLIENVLYFAKECTEEDVQTLRMKTEISVKQENLKKIFSAFWDCVIAEKRRTQQEVTHERIKNI